MDERVVGITTTVPMEILFAAGLRPLDLNNAFITSDDPGTMVAEAERAGFPRTMCAWVKGLYAAVHRLAVRRTRGAGTRRRSSGSSPVWPSGAARRWRRQRR